jgi:hypothetical protein
MSKNLGLTAVAVIEFDSLVKHAYAGMGLLKPSVTVRNNVVGETYKFRKMGTGLANQKSTADLVTPMDVTHEVQTATMQNWNAPEYTDIFDQAEVNFDEKQELATTIAGALSRREDQLIIDVMNGASPTTVAHGNGGLTMAKVIEASTTLRKQNVPSTDLHAAINGDGLKGLLSDTQATSSDFQTVKALVSGDINTLAGFAIHVVGTRSEGGLSVASSGVVDSYFYHKEAVGLAIGIEMKTSIDYIPERTAFLCNGMLKAGAVVRDADGIIKVEYK